MTDFSGPKQLIYMPDTNVIAMVVDGNPVVIAEVRGMKARGVKFIVPAQTMVEIKNDPDAVRKGAQLAFIRDFGMDVQPPGVAPSPSGGVSPAVREAYLKANPQLRGKPVSDEAITTYIKANPEFASKIAKIQSPISAKDRLVLLDVQRQTAIEGNGKDVRCLTYEKFAGEGPQGNVGQKKRIALEFGIKIADESRKVKREKVFIQPEHLWEIMPELRGKMISRKVVDANGALGRPPTIPPVPSAPAGALRFGGKLGQGMRLVGLVLIDVIVGILVQILLQKVVDRIQKEVMDREMKQRVHPPMIADLSILANRKQVFDLLVAGKKAFGAVRLKYFHFDAPLLNPSDPQDPLTHVDYEALISISDVKIDPMREVVFLEELPAGGNRFFDRRQSGKRVTFSIELTYSQEEIELYRVFNELIDIARTNFEACKEFARDDPSEPLDGMRFWGSMLGEFQAQQLNAMKQAGSPTLL